MFTQDNPKEDSIMEVLNIVFSALNLLATVIIGVINVTWMISRDVGADLERNIIPKAKKIDRLCSPTDRSIFFN